MMELLLDEMFAGLKEYFEILGWNVRTVQEVGLQGKKDKDIVKYALDNNFLLVTQDQKPAELADLLGAKYILVSKSLVAKVANSKILEKYFKERK
jgi:predicted nuclease of predicted toxin-antitoxin system